MHQASITHDPKQGASILDYGGDIRLRELLRVARGPVRHGKRDAREGAVEELVHRDGIQSSCSMSIHASQTLQGQRRT